jgi:nephrocystin-4
MFMWSRVVCSVITDPREWRHFKLQNEVYTAIEEGMFNTDSGKPQLFLRPKESVHIPFKFLTFKADHQTHTPVS